MSIPTNMILLGAIMGLIPITVILTTSFIKIAMVLILTRESLGVQQVPPNIFIYALSLVLTLYTTGGIFNSAIKNFTNNITSEKLNTYSIVNDIANAATPMRQFLIKHSPLQEKQFFMHQLSKFWTKEDMSTVTINDFIIIVPAFVVNEISQAFKIGMTLYLPSVIIDIVIANILMALGMMMMSPVTISLPIKLLLFVSVDGWNRIINLLFNSY